MSSLSHQISGSLPAHNVDDASIPGHWLLARMGKRVLRPGGIEATRFLLHALNFCPTDRVIELAPGLGITAKLTLQNPLQHYTAVDQDPAVVRWMQRLLASKGFSAIQANAHQVPLPDAVASVVYGEAMLSMQSNGNKQAIIREAARLLQPGGRYAFHELLWGPDEQVTATEREMQRDLAHSIHHGVQPLTLEDWSTLLQGEGFRIRQVKTFPMHLLEPYRILQDEGLWRTLQFAYQFLTKPSARQRVLAMRKHFKKYENALRAVVILCEKQ